MEYLSRVMQYITGIVPFKYHPLCSKLRLSHLIFADDLLLFSKGDAASIMVLLRVFATFCQTSGLQMNNSKTNAYLNSVQGSIISEILQISGFLEGLLPFSYLGVPITAGRLKNKDCQILIEKLVSRIRGFGARHLSYAGRLVLELSLDGKVDFIEVPLVSWEKVCVPKKEGGLGIRDSYAWNVADIGKLVWWIFSKLDSLWVRWVHHVYMKDAALPDYIPKTDVSWSWKPIVKVRDKFLGNNTANLWQGTSRGYSVSSGYEEALQMKDKFFKFGCCNDALWLLYGAADKIHSHVFQKCEYSSKILSGVAHLCGS
ncbi:uncharacterized protein LOC141613343 [Silene latifolia]|uniref:uncharacterized protein LOC141613343 n=1 Tax=Silene latifolia TaxID=37657 RepID=UPI003D787023